MSMTGLSGDRAFSATNVNKLTAHIQLLGQALEAKKRLLHFALWFQATQQSTVRAMWPDVAASVVMSMYPAFDEHDRLGLCSISFSEDAQNHCCGNTSQESA